MSGPSPERPDGRHPDSEHRASEHQASGHRAPESPMSQQALAERRRAAQRPLFALRAMGLRAEIWAEGEIPEGFLDSLRASWADCEPTPITEEEAARAREDRAVSRFDRDPDGRNGKPWGLLTAPRDPDAPSVPLPGDVADFSVEVGGPETWPLASQQFTTSLTMALIRQYLGQKHLFHAASLMDPETGATAVLVGPSGRGKTTASIALARNGWAYLTDETTAVEHGSPDLVPYAKPLSVIEVPDEPKVQSAASSLGMRLRRPEDPQPHLERILVMHRLGPEDADADVDRLGAVLEPMDRFDALQILMEQSSGLARTPDGLRGLAELADSVGGIHRVSYRESEHLADALRDWFRTGTAPARTAPAEGAPEDDVVPAPWTFHPAARDDDPIGLTPQTPDADRDPGTVRWIRDPWSQGIESAGEALVLRKDRSCILNPLASRIWLLLEEPLDAEELAERLEPDFGPAPEGAVAGILETLLAGQLVVPAGDADAPSGGEAPGH